MKRKGILTVVSGFSGAGKGTVMKALMAEYKDTYALSVSATTRNRDPEKWMVLIISSVPKKNLNR